VIETSPTAVLFPGQGSQVPAMRDRVADVRPDLLDAVIGLVGEDPFCLVDESTRFAQPAIFCASLAGWELVCDRVQPVALAGHSLGELSALAAAGVLDDHDALRLVVLRGRLMAESGAASGGGTMLALLGATPQQAGELAGRHDVSIANDNAPGQIVLSGDPEALRGVRKDARADGLRAIALDVAGAFHSPQMQAAVAPFRDALAETELQPPDIAVLSCASARPFQDPREELADALVTPVRWRETMDALAAAGARSFVDTGPGGVLAKLAPRCVPGVAAVTLDTLLDTPLPRPAPAAV
jgi:[acyl-carrier-protein] S-malonyltransferase